MGLRCVSLIALALVAVAACSSEPCVPKPCPPGASPCSCGEDNVGGAIQLEGGVIGFDGSGPSACAAAGGQCVHPFSSTSPCTLVGPKDACNPDQPGPEGSFCCAVAPDANCSEIQASNYDQSCKVDSDCTGITSNTSCLLCGFGCTNGAINVADEARYLSDIANTTAYLSKQRHGCDGDCGVNFVCCVSGRCQWGPQCPAPVVPIREAGTDAVSDTGRDAATGAAADASASDAADAAGE